MPVPIPNIVSGQAIGTAIVAQTSADLSAMSTQGIAIGSLVYNSEVGSHFMLSVSNSALVPGQVLAVNGIDNYRWTLFTGGSASFGIPPNNTYASPTGNEANDGLSWATAKLYASSAFTEVQGLFGGVVNIAPNTLASPVTGTGLNIRGPFDAGIGGVGWLDQSYPFGLLAPRLCCPLAARG